MPALSPTMSQGNLVAWHVKLGDEVKSGSVLADIETDKATLAFENQDDGFVAKLLVADGTRDIPIGQPVVVLADDASSIGAFANYSPGGAAPTPATPAASPPPSGSAAPAAAAPAPAKAYPPHIVMTMPSLSPTMDRGNIVEWKVKPGDAIKPGDVMAEIETDKATLGFENVADEGFVARILVPSGARDIPVGAQVAILVEDEASIAAFADYTADGASSSSSGSSGAGAEVVEAVEAAAAAPAAPPRVVASDRLGPAVRHLLGSAGLSPEDVTPTGPRNIITKGDVLAAIEAGVRPGSGAAAAAAAAVAAAAPAPKAPAPAAAAAPPAAKPAPPPASAAPPKPAAPAAAPLPSGGSYTNTPNSQIRRIIAARLLDSKRNTPTMYLSVDAGLDAIADLRAALAAKGTKVSVNDCVLRAVALALRDVPAANVFWDEKAGEIRPFPSIDISVAVATERGLITPIVKGADRKGLLAVAKDVRALALKARENKLKPEEFMGGSFTVSNLGMFGLSSFSAIINPPQAGILAIGGGQERVVLRGGEPAVTTVMTVTLSADSRVYDGELSGAFLESFRNHMEKPYELVGSS
ncbi:Dihydrolipoyllysine-residue acetyltransferase [Tetrabaena socialis]|uniref:Dihydrolipoamide acetyltransferase component of pyruvate dehydrogenase complex n=1 Tax=Tetrabaena socialis TaxID=47790 RepID=A0A2J8A4M7_9CHLO|nr:Dihydrolipoyllysine-residue acetyltransferase [Tetrabaena socialis]|eukprot:PNH07466.1 Dihydrolipoyllysine-residue acetyltransferase [Tetrabaena socialis]